MGREPPTAYSEALRRRNFELKERIGAGAFGSVYRAQQVSLDRPVAVKFCDSPVMRGEAYRKRFSREAKILARVEHRCIPYVLTTGEVRLPDAEAVPYFIMQYVSGQPLNERLSKGRMDADEVYAVTRDVISALQRAHDLRFVHRDVKPSNILLSTQGTFLVDFSVGISLAEEAGFTRATRLGEAVGTEDYAAPEQLSDASTVDHRADVYSAGVVLAEMLGARVPLRREALEDDLAVPAPVREVVLRAVARRREERFQSASELLEGLEAAIGPAGTGLFDEAIVLCPNTECAGARWSEGGKGYYWGPKIVGPTRDRFCDHCGTEYLRGCPGCHRALPENISKLVVKEAKTEPDALLAHCVRCGTRIFCTPTCEECGSYLHADDMGVPTRDEGCSKCRRESSFDPDSDIPF